MNKVEKLRDALLRVLERDEAKWDGCGCINFSRLGEREYETGTCPHQNARKLLKELSR